MALRILSWVLTVPFLIAFGGALLIFDPLQRIARLFGQRPQERVAGALQVALVAAFRLAGTRVEVEHSSLVRPNSPYLFISNHQSLFDIPILGAALFSNYPKYVSKIELAKGIPSISYNLRRGGNAIIDRDDRDQAMAAIRELGVQVVERGVSAVIYPEGTRARKGKLRTFRSAGAIALFESAPGIPVVSVTIDGSWELLQYNLLPVPFGTRVRVKIGDPIERKPEDDPSAIIQASRAEIAATLEAWRSEEG